MGPSCPACPWGAQVWSPLAALPTSLLPSPAGSQGRPSATQTCPGAPTPPAHCPAPHGVSPAPHRQFPARGLSTGRPDCPSRRWNLELRLMATGAIPRTRSLNVALCARQQRSAQRRLALASVCLSLPALARPCWGTRVTVTRPSLAPWGRLCVGRVRPGLCPPEPSRSRGAGPTWGGLKVGLPGPLPGGAWCPCLGSEGPGATSRHCVPHGGRPCPWRRPEAPQHADRPLQPPSQHRAPVRLGGRPQRVPA